MWFNGFFSHNGETFYGSVTIKILFHCFFLNTKFGSVINILRWREIFHPLWCFFGVALLTVNFNFPLFCYYKTFNLYITNLFTTVARGFYLSINIHFSFTETDNQITLNKYYESDVSFSLNETWVGVDHAQFS